MVSFIETITTAKEGIYTGDLGEKLKLYSPDFKLESCILPLGAGYSLFNEKDPSYIYIQQIFLLKNWIPVFVSSYNQDLNERLLENFEKVGIELREPDVGFEIKQMIKGLKTKISQKFETLVA